MSGGGDFIVETAPHGLIGFFGFVQYYPNPRQGLFAQGLVGVLGAEGPNGPFGALGGGYDHWIGSQWCIGVSARLGASRATGDIEWDDGETTAPGKSTAFFGSVAFTVTYH